jgi:hypothetical protein
MQDQKKPAFLKIFPGFLIIGCVAIKYIKSGVDPGSVNNLSFIAIGILLPLSSSFGLLRVRAEEKKEIGMTEVEASSNL